MRLKNSFFAMVCVLITFSCDTSSVFDTAQQPFFRKFYGVDGNQEAVDMLVDGDRIFLLAHSVQPSGAQRIYFVQLDLNGNVLVEKLLGGDLENAQDIEKTPDGDYVILSNVNKAPGSTTHDVKIIRVDAEGNKSDSAVINFWNDQFAQSITALSGGDFVVTGRTADASASAEPPAGNYVDVEDYFAVRVNSLLDEQWRLPIGAGSMTSGIKIYEKNDTLLYSFGYSDYHINTPSANLEYNFWFTRLKGAIPTAGSSPFYAGVPSSNETTVAVTVLPSEFGAGFVVVGTQSSSSNQTIYFTRINDSNNPADDSKFQSGADISRETSITFSTSSLEAVAVTPTLQNSFGYLIVANEFGLDNQRNQFLAKVDLNGGPLWFRSFGWTGDDTGASVAELSDGKILVAGTVFLSNQKKVSLMKLNSEGKLEP